MGKGKKTKKGPPRKPSKKQKKKATIRKSHNGDW